MKLPAVQISFLPAHLFVIVFRPCRGRRAHMNYSPAPRRVIENIDITPILSRAFPQPQGVTLTVRTELTPHLTLEPRIPPVLLRPFPCETILQLARTF